MEKFCSNCGKELNEGQDVCLGCGKLLNTEQKKQKTHNGYKVTTGIIMIVISFFLLCAAISGEYASPTLIFTLPGLLGMASGILILCSKNNSSLLMVSGILLFIGALFNIIGLFDLSIFSIISIIFGIFNIIYWKK